MAIFVNLIELIYTCFIQLIRERFIMKRLPLLFFIGFLLVSGCNKDEQNNTPNEAKELIIFCINDVHAQIDNFSKVKHIIDDARQNNEVIVVSAGDLFSGNPVVDNHSEKGYPLIDIMNKVGFDVAVLGNHEFDYGPEHLKNRIVQSDFEWICANFDAGNSGVPQTEAYTSLELEDLKITFLGLVETNGKADMVIPLTHPWKVEEYIFSEPEATIKDYANLREMEEADITVALTHLGFGEYNYALSDFRIATKYPYFDLIIGGHSHEQKFEYVNNIPVFQSGAYLNYLGKIIIEYIGEEIESLDFNLINLNEYTEYDKDLHSVIEQYNDLPELKEVIGYANIDHYKNEVGCFYTDALQATMNVDITFQNTGGVRAAIFEGDITKRDIYEVSPFNNGTVIYSMSVAEIKHFLSSSSTGYYYAGVVIEQEQDRIIIRDTQGNEMSDETVLSLGINDYIPAVYDYLFPEDGNRQELTAAETLIYYLENINGVIDYSSCARYFRFVE